MDIEPIAMNKDNSFDNLEQRVLTQAGLGSRLKRAREACQLSEKEAAIRLHLNPKIIAIMESEDFENGPPATFMRGYLRSYARILNIPEEEINAAVAHLETNLPQAPLPASPPIFSTQSSNDYYRYLRWMTYLVAGVLILLVSMWWSSHSKDMMALSKSLLTPPKPATTSEVTQTLTTTTAPVVAPAPPAVGTPAPTTTPAATTTMPTTPAPVAPNAQAPLTPGTPPATVAPTMPTTPAPEIKPTAPTNEPAAQTQDDMGDMEMALPEPGLEHE